VHPRMEKLLGVIYKVVSAPQAVKCTSQAQQEVKY